MLSCKSVKVRWRKQSGNIDKYTNPFGYISKLLSKAKTFQLSASYVLEINCFPVASLFNHLVRLQSNIMFLAKDAHSHSISVNPKHFE